MQLSKAIEEYMFVSTAEGKAEGTIEAIQYHLGNFFKYAGDLDVEEIDAHLLRGFIAHEMSRESKSGGKLSSASVHKAYSVVRALMRWMERERIIEHSPTDRVRAPRIETKMPEPLSREEMQRLLKYLRTQASFRDRVIFEFFLDTGARLAEVIALNLEDINLKEGFCKVMGKGSKEGMLPLGQNLRKDLYAYIHRHRKAVEGEEALFTSRFGTRLSREGMATMIKRTMKRVRVKGKYGPHKLRHTFATNFLRNGGNLEALRRILRHGDIQTTQIYTHLGDDDIQSAHRRASPIDNL